MKANNSNIENLESIISKLKNQGIEAGESEKQRIIQSANDEAEKIMADARAKSNQMIEDAKKETAQMEKNAKAAVSQASRDVIEATKLAILDKLKQAFRKQSDALLTQEQYLQEILKIVAEILPGKKQAEVAKPLAEKMQAFLVNHAIGKEMEIKPLPGNEAKITLTQSEKDGLQFVLTSKDIENAVFSLLNHDLVELITKNQEA